MGGHEGRGEVRETVVGDLQLADDTALVGGEEELRMAERILTQTMTD